MVPKYVGTNARHIGTNISVTLLIFLLNQFVGAIIKSDIIAKDISYSVEKNVGKYRVVQHTASGQKIGGHKINKLFTKHETNQQIIVLDLMHWVELNLNNLLKLSFILTC